MHGNLNAQKSKKILMDEIILIKNKEVMAMRKNDRETTQGKNI
jgi:hypothetical protein